MPTYYQVLKLEPSASVEAIETAIDDLYNQYHRLVTRNYSGFRRLPASRSRLED